MMMNNYKRIFLVIALALPIIGCSDNGYKTIEKINYKNHELTIIYEFNQKVNKDIVYPLANLLDNDDNTKWNFYGDSSYIKNSTPKCSGKINFQFSEAVKIDTIKIKMDKLTKNMPKKVAVNLYYGKELQLMNYYGEWLEYDIGNFDNINLDIINKQYTLDFYIQSFSINFKECYKDIGTAIINDIDIIFSKSSSFIPTKSFKKILSILNNKNLVKKLNRAGLHGELWRVKKDIKGQDSLIDDLRRNLIHYALNGNEDAENIFLSDMSRYKKIEGIYGRDPRGLEDWYFYSKKVFLQKK